MLDDEKSRLASPQALSFSLAKASFQEGNPELAQIHLADLKLQQMAQQIQTLQAMMVLQSVGQPPRLPSGPSAPAGSGGGANNAPQPPGFAPEAMSFIAQNGAPAPGPRNAGPNQPPGAPRPGARTPNFGPTAMPPWAR